MANGYFHIKDVSNELEIQVVDAFLSQVENTYIGNERDGKPIPIKDIGNKTSPSKTKLFTVAGLISSFLLLVIVWGEKPYALTFFALLGLLGYGYTFLQLKRSESYIEAIIDSKERVQNFKIKSDAEIKLEELMLKNNKEKTNESTMG